MGEDRFKIVGDNTFGLKHIKPIGRGSVPKELRGSFTNDSEATKAITSFLGKEGKVNDEAKRNIRK